MNDFGRCVENVSKAFGEPFTVNEILIVMWWEKNDQVIHHKVSRWLRKFGAVTIEKDIWDYPG